MIADKTINGKQLSYEIEEDGYKIYLGGIPWISQTGQYSKLFVLDGTFEENALEQINELTAGQDDEGVTQDDINAEMLLNQADIQSKQLEQDEVLAEILLNQMGA